MKKHLLKHLPFHDFHFREIFKGSSMAFFFKILSLPVGYALAYLIARNYGAAVNGLFNLALMVIVVATVISKAGLDTALLKYAATLSALKQWGEIKSVYIHTVKIVGLLSIIITLILFFFAPYISLKVFKKPDLVPYIQYFSFTVFPYSMYLINSECLRALKIFRYHLFFEGLSLNLINAVVLFFFFVINKSTELLMISFVAAVYLTFILSTIVWIKKSGIAKITAQKSVGLKELIYTSLPMLTSTALLKVMGWTDTLILGILSTAENVGIYSIALKISFVTRVSLMAVNTISAPRFAEYHSKNEPELLIKTSDHATRLIFWTSAPVLLIIFLFPEFITGLFGEEFKAGAIALMILAAGQFISSISGSVGYILNMTGYQVIQQNIAIASIILSVVLNILLIPVFGITGAAIASTTGLAFRNLVSVYYIKKKFNFTTIYLPFIRQRKKE